MAGGLVEPCGVLGPSIEVPILGSLGLGPIHKSNFKALSFPEQSKVKSHSLISYFSKPSFFFALRPLKIPNPFYIQQKSSSSSCFEDICSPRYSGGYAL